MEQEHGEHKVHGEASGGTTTTLRAQLAEGAFPLGYFLQPHPSDYEYPSVYGPPCPDFVSISKQGNTLRAGKWGSLDASLSFLEQPVLIIGSSHGFLLCCDTNIAENMNYIICNPVTREYLILPQPHRAYKYVAVAFICNGDDTSLGEVRYEVIRAGVANPKELMTILEIETFSSETGEWEQSSVVSPSPFRLVVALSHVIVLGDIVYWKDPGLALVAYDRANKHVVQVINLPRETFRISADYLSVSKGKIYYAKIDGVIGDPRCMEVWVLKEDGWSIKHRVNLTGLIKQYPGLYIYNFHMHPRNSKKIFFGSYLYDVRSQKFRKLGVDRIGYEYFLYEWPSAALPQR